MLDTLGIVPFHFASLTSDEAARREAFLTRRFAGKMLLEWIIRRATEAQWLDGVILLTGESEVERQIAAHVPSDIPVLACSECDALAACAKAIEQFPCRSVVLLATDSPFVDPALIDRLVITSRENPQCDYVSYCLRDGRPTVLSEIGVFAEWCTADAICRANRKATASEDRQSCTRFLYSHPEEFQLRFLPSPAELDRGDLRLTVTCEEDWDHSLEILEALGADSLEWQRITDLLAQQPALRRRMASLNQAAVSAPT